METRKDILVTCKMKDCTGCPYLPDKPFDCSFKVKRKFKDGKLIKLGFST